MVVDHDVNLLLVSVPSCGLRLVLPYARIRTIITLYTYYSRSTTLVHRCTLASMHTVVVCILILLATIDAYYGIKYPYSFLVVATLVVVL